MLFDCVHFCSCCRFTKVEKMVLLTFTYPFLWLDVEFHDRLRFSCMSESELNTGGCR